MAAPADTKRTLLGPFLSILGIVIAILMLDAWYGVKRYHTFRNNQLALIENQVELVARNISDQLDLMRSQTNVFASLYSEKIGALARDPQNASLQRN